MDNHTLMKITFGIVTAPDSSGNLPNSLHRVFESIAADESYDDVEILVVGGKENKTVGDYRFISFDESIKPRGWITRKKNIITAEAKYDNIVYMHDYVSLMPGWFKGMEEFGENWDVCMTRILNADGTRFRDWTLWGDDLVEKGVFSHKHSNYLLPYNVGHLSKCMYISGAYWIAKRHVMERFPLDGALTWGESEDVKWSMQVRKYYKFTMNELSAVKMLKQKERVFNEATPEIIKQVEAHIETL